MAINFTPPEQPEWATATQWGYLKAIEEHGSVRKAEIALGLSRDAVGKSIRAYHREAAKHGHAPGHFNDGVAPGFMMGKVTIQRGPGGVVERVWERQSPNNDPEALAAIVAGLSEDLPRAEPLDAPDHCDEDLITLYPQGDPHAGLASWKDETGHHFDLAEFERITKAAIDRLVASTPPSALAIYNDKGDLTHADNNKNRTPKSGHELDVQGRHSEVVRVALRCKRHHIARMLEKHQKVIVRIDPGNHDGETALMIALMLAAIYENEPRVEVITSPNPYWYFPFGKNLIGTCHGDGAKGKDLPGIMANDVRQLWGQAEHCLWLVGHIHHKDIKEYTGCTVEYLRTLAAPDAYCHGAGYRSKRDMQAITLHRDFGEVERHTCSVAMLEKLAA